jgi:uncharacterized membrane protein YcaP (DUF421 family)
VSTTDHTARGRGIGSGAAGKTALPSDVFFSTWQSLLRVVVVGVCGYAALIVLLRLYGKRSLSKFNAFDLVVTVAIGSVLATLLLSKDAKLLDGVVAFMTLLSLQFLVTWFSRRFHAVNRLVKSEPALLYYQGRFLEDSLRRERVTEGEVRSAVREQGIASMQDVYAVVLETSGNISVIPGTSENPTALIGVSGAAQQEGL